MTRPLTSTERQRLRSPANLWRALLPLLVIVGLLVLFSWPRGQRPDGVHVIDPSGAVAAARQSGGFEPVVPGGLGDRWRPTSAEFVPSGPSGAASLRIGYVSPGGRYAELFESPDAPDAVAAQYGPLVSDGSAVVNGVDWSRYQTRAGRPLLRHTAAKVTVIVTGNAGQPELVELAAALR